MNRAQAIALFAMYCAALIAAASCGDDTTPGAGEVQRDGLFGPSVESVTFEVDYAPGAEPYTAFNDGPDSPWQLTRANLERMFQSNSPELVIPTTLGEMNAIDVGEGPYDVDAILSIAESNRDLRSTRKDRSFYIVFLDGYYADETGVRDTVLGVSIGDTGVIAMFKPVIASTSGPLGGVARFVEQTTVVHEFGHAAGLVNNGLAMVDDHHDEANGAHCDNDECVMYWANEGAAGLVEFVSRYVSTGETIVFGPECLADVDAAD